MFCTKCGIAIGDTDSFCSQCGTSTHYTKGITQDAFLELGDTAIIPEKEICGKCNQEKRNVYQKDKYSGRNICIKCESTPGKCPICKRKLRTNKAQQCASCSSSWRTNIPQPRLSASKAIVKGSQSNEIKCSKCKSTSITANKKGFGAGKALAGAILTGGIGLIWGFTGSKKIIITCLNCGHQWSPQK